jgi:two-component system, sensor histidine kinase and response regulator
MKQEVPFTILVVDDEQLNLDIIRETLVFAGFQPELFNSPKDALAKLRANFRPDLIISDLNMPVINGFMFYEQVREIPELDMVPFIFLTSISDEDNIRYGKELGADDYIQKPFKAANLISCIKGKLKRAKRITRSVDSEMNKIKEKILEMLSHELRTPVTSMVGFASLLSDESLSQEELKSFAEMIQAGGDRLQNLTENFMESMASETGDMRRTYDSLKNRFNPLNPLLEALNACEPLLVEKELFLERFIPDNIPEVFACEPQITNILKRIIDNAVKFTKAGKKIKVRMESNEQFLDISIQDEGRGIVQREIPKIYDKFYQVDRDKYEQQGSGLGLYIVRKLVEVNKCQIICDSIVGEGTTFTLKIPIQRID